MRSFLIIMLGLFSLNSPIAQTLLEKEFGSYNYTRSGYYLDSEGNIFITTSVDEIEAQNITILPGAYQDFYGGGINDIYIEKRSPDGTLLWNTFFGGEKREGGSLIITDQALYLVGSTRSATNISTPGTFQENLIPVSISKFNSYIVQFDLDGQRLWGTYYRTTAADVTEYIYETVVDDTSKNIFITGITQSIENVSTPGAFDDSLDDAAVKGFIAKFDDTGNRVWGTYYGTYFTSMNDLKMDSSGNIIFSGEILANTESFNYYISGGAYDDGQNLPADLFMAKFNPNGERIWGLMYGGVDIEHSYAINVDSQDNIVWQGSTRSLTDIATPGSHQPELGSINPINGTGDSFLAKFDTNGLRLWATYYGGQFNDSYDNVSGSGSFDGSPNTLFLDENDNIYFTSITKSENNIATTGIYQDLHNDPATYDGYIAKFKPDGIRSWGTFFGGENNDYPNGILYNGNDEFYIYGNTQSTTGIATPNGIFGDDTYPPDVDYTGFLMKFRPTQLGLGENAFSAFTISPNPAKAYFQINSDRGESFSVTIYDVQGRIFKQMENAQTGQTIKTEKMSQGMYFVNLKTANRDQTLKLLVE